MTIHCRRSTVQLLALTSQKWHFPLVSIPCFSIAHDKNPQTSTEPAVKLLPSTEVDVEDSLQQLVRDEGDAKLRRRAAHSRDGALPESPEAFLGVDLTRRVRQAVVCRLAFPGDDLEKDQSKMRRRDIVPSDI